MMTYLFLLLLAGVSLASGDLTKFTVDISKPDFSKMEVLPYHFDNVTSFVCKPLPKFQLVGVYNGKQDLWLSSHSLEKVNYLLFTLGYENESLLFLKTEAEKYKEYYFYSSGDEYFPITFQKYVEDVNILKNRYKSTPFTLNLETVQSNEKFQFAPTTNSKDYETYVPNRSFLANEVYYGVRLLWRAHVEDQKAACVWVYKKSGSRFLVRILVSDKNSNFRFFNFIAVGRNWLSADAAPFAFLHEDDTKFPKDFYFPQYLYGKPNRNLFGNTGPLTTKDDFLDPTFSFKPESTMWDHDFTYFTSKIPFNKCFKLDFSKRVPSSLGSTHHTKFDRVLQVTSVYPKSGNFFSRVADGSLVLFERNLDSEACVGVHFYSKDKKRYLADVLVTSPTNSRSEYHLKTNGHWKPVSKEAFLDLLSKLNQKS